jgi:hypothetical protein
MLSYMAAVGVAAAAPAAIDVLHDYGSDTFYNADTIAKAIRGAGSDKVTLVIKAGTWKVNNDLFIPGSISLQIPYYRQ